MRRAVARTLLPFLFLLTGAAGASETEDMLAAHNAVRAKAGVPPLVWSDRLAESARKWAETLLARNEFAHPANPPYGQNLLKVSGTHPRVSPGEVVSRWAAEARNYDYRSNRCTEVCGHYTQLVWRDTQAVGCGVARDDRTEIWACDYDPPGNVVGERPY